MEVDAFVTSEFTGAVKWPDKRLEKRVQRVARQIAVSPSAPIPKAAGSDGQTEAIYRFLNNDRVTADLVLSPHVQATVERGKAARLLIVAHDTSEFEFDSTCDARSIGYTSAGRAGFYAHFSLAIDAGSPYPEPLGVVGLKQWNRTKKPSPKGESTTRKRSGAQCAKQEERETSRWHEKAIEVGRLFGEEARPIHVMDREADSFAIFSELLGAKQSFVIRITRRQRRAKQAADPDSDSWSTMTAVAEGAATVANRDVHLARRVHKARKGGPRTRAAFPPRDERVASLSISAERVRISRPRYGSAEHPKELELNVVRVFEPNPPDGAEPVEWLLVTDRPVDTVEDILGVVDIYRRRWLIEEFIKALKTGTAYMERRLESGHALYNMMALSIPIAWRLLSIRAQARNSADAPADETFADDEITVLRRFSSRKLSPRPTVKEAYLAIAGLGGHLKSNGEPGWQVLWRGYEEFQLRVEVWRAATSPPPEAEM